MCPYTRAHSTRTVPTLRTLLVLVTYRPLGFLSLPFALERNLLGTVGAVRGSVLSELRSHSPRSRAVVHNYYLKYTIHRLSAEALSVLRFV